MNFDDISKRSQRPTALVHALPPQLHGGSASSEVERAASKPPLAPEEAAAEEGRPPVETPSVSIRGARGSPPTDYLTTCLDLLREQQGGLIPRADWPREVALGYN